MYLCAVPGCGSCSSLNKECTFHRLPSSLIHRARWTLGLGPLPCGSYVCSRHFEESMFMKCGNQRRIKPDAVPKLILDSSPTAARSNLSGDSEEAGSSGSPRACRACLATDGRLLPLRGSGWEPSLAALAGVQLSAEEGFPCHLCVFCLAKLSKCAAFRDSCQRSAALLRTLLERGPLKINDIKAIDRSSHQLTDNLTTSEVLQCGTGSWPAVLPKIKIENDEHSHDEANYTEVEYLEEHFTKNDVEVYPFEVPVTKKEISETRTDKLKAESVKYKKKHMKTEAADAHCEIYGYEVENDTSDTTHALIKRGKRKIMELRKAKAEKRQKVTNVIKNDTDTPEEPMKNDTDTSKEPMKNDTDTSKEPMKNDTDTSKEPMKNDTDTSKEPMKNDTDTSKEPMKNDTDTSKEPMRIRRRVRNPDVDSAFDRKYNCTTTVLSLEEQKQFIADRKKNSNSAFSCRVCGKRYNTSTTLMTHMTYHNSKSLPAECDVCLLRFRSRRYLLRHKNTHTTTFRCNECGYVSRQRTHAKNHSLTHKGATYTCPYCQKVFNYPTSYYNHIRMHHPGQNEPCDVCGETFAAGRGILLHRARAHKLYEDRKVVSKCAVCEVTFVTAEALQRHEELSVGAAHAQWPCGACGDSCASDDAREAHAAEKHPPGAQNYCKECDKTFASAGSFALHVDRKHLDLRAPSDPTRRAPRRRDPGALRDYSCVCELCGKRYSCRVTLEYHMNVHLGLKPFQCPHCPKAFPHKTQLRMHIMVHTGERPYQCKQCPLAFSRPSNFARHVQNVHLRMRVKCERCGKMVGAASLPSHVRAVHMNMPYVRKRDRTKKKLGVVTES